MLKSKLFLIIILFPILAISQGLPKEINSIINQKNCDSQYVFTTIIRANKLKKYFPKNVFDKFYNLSGHHLNIDNQAKKDLIEAISQFYKRANAQNVIIRIIKNWCLENNFLNALATNLEFPPEAILYNTRMTKFLVLKYIPKNLPGQDWSGLASYQLYELDIDYLNYVDTLTNSEKKELYAELRITSQKHK